ncbi:MAG: PEP-CTERM sorting domain-containing protein [Puniceicoccaceae bacterium]
MKKLTSGLLFGLLSATPFIQAQTIPASFDTTFDFWSGVANSDWSTQTQSYASNAAMWPVAGDAIYHTEYDPIGMLIQFDLGGVTSETVNTPGFQATLDVMFQGFYADENRYADYNPDPSGTPGAGDGLIYLDVYGMGTTYTSSANRWMANSTSGSFLNWDGSSPTNFAEATAESGNFNMSLLGPVVDQTTFVTGWDVSTPGATQPNQYGELVWDVTTLVQDWVNGTTPNNGLFIHVNKSLSWGEQVNLLSMEMVDASRGLPNLGDATPLLNLTIVPEPGTYAAIFGGLFFAYVLFMRKRRAARD